MKRVFALFVIAVICFSFISCGKENDEASRASVSQTEISQTQTDNSVDFTVYDSQGKAVKLSDFRGKPVVLNFWATWCPPCVAELPDFQKQYKANSDVEFIMINLDSASSDAYDFMEENNYDFPVYFDVEGEASVLFQVTGIPTTCFINENGEVVQMKVGMLTESQLIAGYRTDIEIKKHRL